VQMPDLNGFETATIIYEREKLKSIPIIFITAHTQDEDYLFKGYRMGGVDYIYKPINPELLRAKVAVFVELYRKNLQLKLHEQKLLAANSSLQKQIEERKASEEKVRMLNEQLLQNNRHLKSVNEELDRFAYVASHDLQEPLRKIMVFSDKIQGKGDADSETSKYLQKITTSSQRMQSLINDLLNFSRHSVSADDFRRTDLNMIVKEAVAELELEIERSGAVINVEHLPTVNVIPSMIRQVFYNLVCNALKFRKAGTIPVVTISATKADGVNGSKRSGGYYAISIKDNGIGFNPKYADEIFMVFKRLHSYHEFEGTGMGLSICKKIMEKHNGYITAKSKPDEGATFTLGLPVEN
jgi:light-regulated signal transduction histidine kinase (bacteriophytochrome)